MFKSLRYALRLLRKTPGFTLVAICSLALGIGSTAAMFSFTDALLLRPLPVEEPSQIAAVTSTDSATFGTGSAVSYPDYRDFRDNNRSFDGLFAAGTSSFGVSPNPSTLPKVTYGFFVSGNFFRALHVRPALGRGFLDSEDQAVGRDPVVVLGHDYWVSQFNASPSVLGSAVWLNGVQCTIIGVAPAEFTGIDQFFKPSLFVPLAMSPRLGQDNLLEKRDIRWLTVKGRLKPGVTVAQANADVSAIANRLEQTYPQDRGRHAEVQSELELRIKQSPPNTALSIMLLLLSLCVLLVACANVTGLLLSRTRARSREIAIRLAIGAGRGALIRQLLLENLLLALGGGGLGIAIAYLGASFFNSIPIPTDVPLVFHVSVDQRMLFFTVAASLLSTFIFGLTPALQTTRVDLVSSLKAADADSSGRRRLWGRNLIVSGQVALSLVLLIVSAVMLQGFHDELQQGPGFRIHGLYLTSLDTQPIHYSEDQSRRFYKDLLDKTRRAPGVRSAALISDIPLLGGQGNGIVPEGYALPRGEQAITVFNYLVSDGFFDTMGVPILRGRAFTDADRADTPMVAVINEHMANHFWPKQDALGKRFHLHNATGPLVAGGGHRAQRQVFLDRRTALGFYVFGVHARQAPGHDPGDRIGRARRGGACARSTECGARHRSQHAGVQRANHGGLLRTACGEDSQHHHAKRRRTRKYGINSGDRGTLRSDRLFGEPSVARDRYPHGDRCRPVQGHSHGAAAGIRIRIDRRSRRPDSQLLCLPRRDHRGLDRFLRPYGLPVVPGHCGARPAGDRAGGLRSGAPSVAHRSDASAAGGVSSNVPLKFATAV